MSRLTPAVPYTVPLHFAEIGSATAAGQRVFNVAANGVSLLRDFDIFAAGGGKAFVAGRVAHPTHFGDRYVEVRTKVGCQSQIERDWRDSNSF